MSQGKSVGVTVLTRPVPADDLYALTTRARRRPVPTDTGMFERVHWYVPVFFFFKSDLWSYGGTNPMLGLTCRWY